MLTINAINDVMYLYNPMNIPDLDECEYMPEALMIYEGIELGKTLYDSIISALKWGFGERFFDSGLIYQIAFDMKKIL